jgi:trehalose-phosphatase
MTQPYPQPVDRLVAAYQAGRPLVLLFDYDGTLTPLVAHPRLARLPERMRHLLRALACRPRVFVGVVSGRTIDNVKRLVDIPGLYYGGTSGLELDLRGVPVTHPRTEDGQALVEEAVRRLRPLAARFPGAWVEHKPLGLTLHYREVCRHLARELCCQARQTFRPCADQWRIVNGAMALEATPALGWTKASAVRMILLDVGGNGYLMYAGDDSNDADALATTASLGGAGIGIGPRAPQCAPHRLPDPAGLEQLLGRLLSVLGPLGDGVEPGWEINGAVQPHRV